MTIPIDPVSSAVHPLGQAQLAAIVESSDDAIVSKDMQGIIRSWNAGAERLFGYSAAEAIGKEIKLIIPPDRLAEERAIMARLLRGERIDHFQTVRRTKQGNLVDISLTISPLLDGAGRVVGASKIARDISAHRCVENRLRTQLMVTQTLAGAASLSEAASKLLQIIGDLLAWDVGTLWCPDENTQVLRCIEIWHSQAARCPELVAATCQQTFALGVGLPGRVWSTGQTAWIPDVTEDHDFLRATSAVKEGLHAAFGFPIVLNNTVLGVIEFLSHEIRKPDTDLLQMMAAVGDQIGQFIERKRTEAALRDSERRFRLMAETVPSIIWTASSDGRITYVNERWFEYCGLTAEKNDVCRPEAALHPKDHDRWVAAWADALQQGTEHEIEVRYRRHDGAYHWFVVRALPFRDVFGRVVHWFGTTTDIDDRKRGELRTQFLADASAALAEGTEFAQTLQKVARLAVPRFANWCSVDLHRADGSLHWQALAKDTEIPDDAVLETMKQDAPASSLAIPLRSRGRALGVLTFATAETGRTFNGADVQAAEDLAHRVVLAIENANLLSELKETSRRKDEFLALLAHELRNPLAPIRAAVEMLRDVGTLPADCQWSVEVIERQLEQLIRLVDDLLDVSRITRGKIELRKQPVELSGVVSTAVEACQPQLEKAGHHFAVDLPACPIVLEADHTRLVQILLNVLNNAIKFTEPFGHIRLSAETQDDQVLIRVKDSGIGISADKLPHIFDMFTQLGSSLERTRGGLGIGLNLVKRLVELHGGCVDVRSDGPGRGSEFTVRLPLGRQPFLAKEASPMEAMESTAPRRVLVVDDNRDAAEVLAALLRTKGHDVQVAFDGLAAVSAALSFRPNVVLLDIGLPKLNGYAVATRIRAQERGDDMLLIALTGWGHEEDRRRARQAGFDHHLTKPIDSSVLQRLLAETKHSKPDT